MHTEEQFLDVERRAALLVIWMKHYIWPVLILALLVAFWGAVGYYSIWPYRPMFGHHGG